MYPMGTNLTVFDMCIATVSVGANVNGICLCIITVSHGYISNGIMHVYYNGICSQVYPRGTKVYPMGTYLTVLCMYTITVHIY